MRCTMGHLALEQTGTTFIARTQTTRLVYPGMCTAAVGILGHRMNLNHCTVGKGDGPGYALA